MKSTFVLSSMSAVIAVGLAAGCGGSGGGRSSGRGTVTIDGSSTVFRISKAAQIGYSRERNPDVQVLVNNSGTGGGFGKYLQGEVDIIDASRAARPKEEEDAAAKGLEWTRFVVGYDGITVVVNPQNDFCEALTVDQLKVIFQPESMVQNWKQVDPSYPDLRMVFYTPDNDSGTFDFFTEAIVGKEDEQRKDVQASSDDNTLVTGVSGDKGAIGYFGFAYYAANTARLKGIAVKETAQSEPVKPTRETILEGKYRPLSRPLYIYVKNSAAKRPEVADFLDYYIKNLDTLATRGGYVPPTESDQAENLAKLAALTGTATAAGDVAAADLAEPDESEPAAPAVSE